MILRTRLGCAIRYAVCTTLFGPVGLVACSNSPPTPPDAFVNATLAASHPNNNQQNTCLFGSPHLELSVGTSSNPPKTVTDGMMQAGASVNISCNVSGGHATLEVSLGGTTGATLSASGPADGSKGVMGDLVSNDGEFSESDCTLSLSFQYAATQVQGTANNGNLWAHLSCPNMVNSTGTVVMLANGSQVAETCDGEADIFLENCSH